MLQIGEDVDYLLIPREVRLAGGVWRVISKPATKEAEFRERLIQFLEEEGRTLEDVARIIEKSTPHPPQPPRKPKEPRVRRRVQQMVTPPPRLVVGTYDSSNASDSELSEFETSRDRNCQGPRRGKAVRRMPVSYLGSKFLGSDLESEDDEELVEAFLRREEKQPSAPPARRRVNRPVPVFEDNLGPRLSKADRWREYVSQVSWGKLKRRVKGWAPRAGTGVGQARLSSTAAGSAGVSSAPDGTSPRDRVGNAGDVCAPETSPRRWRPKMNWASFRRRTKEQTASTGQGADFQANHGGEAADNQREGAIAGQRVEAADNQREGAIAGQRVEAADNQREGAADNQRAGAPADQGPEAADNQREEAADNQREEAPADQGPQGEDNERQEAVDNQRAEAPADQGSEAADNQREEAVHDQRERAPAVQGADNRRAQAVADQRAEAAHNQRAGAPGIQEAEASAAQGATGTVPGASARKQVKTVRFQTPGRFSWFRKRRRAFWHTPRLPILPKRVPRAGEARNLRVLRAEARAEAEQGEQEDQL
ncbi:coiled-coil domain-containing protein 8 isoform X6 [Cebus imitator]|uniref:coiled-coil domain-containing protein 8 isoform X6 n=1 Tax=Cebus imitator TaxID=2715852 RepID=UPI000809D3CD|nr:coiled-coil domain-containing protein 8 isoform X6 [Cebus imitator]